MTLISVPHIHKKTTCFSTFFCINQSLLFSNGTGIDAIEMADLWSPKRVAFPRDPSYLECSLRCPPSGGKDGDSDISLMVW
jgi:hypothetical protein